MITFKQFLAEDVAASKRKPMMHLQNMKPLEFIDWVQSLHDEFGGVLNDLEVSLKVDGLGARFGKGEKGQFFFEGSRTGPIYSSTSFSDHAKSRGAEGEVLRRAELYGELFKDLEKSKLVKSLPKDVKVVCEIFYNPMGQDAGENHMKFVSVSYDKSKLGSLMTVVPLSILVASSGEEHPKAKDILKMLNDASDANIKVVDPKLKVGTIDVRAKTKSILKFGEKERSTIKSLKGADKVAKAALLATIQKAKDELAEYLMSHEAVKGKDKLGKNIEGLVFSASGQPVKVTTQEFKDSKKK